MMKHSKIINTVIFSVRRGLLLALLPPPSAPAGAASTAMVPRLLLLLVFLFCKSRMDGDATGGVSRQGVSRAKGK